MKFLTNLVVLYLLFVVIYFDSVKFKLNGLLEQRDIGVSQMVLYHLLFPLFVERAYCAALLRANYQNVAFSV